MNPPFDLLIRRGTIVDGRGGEPFTADIAIRDAKIAAVGCDLGEANEVVDAGGMLVTPGFVDIHTHYDGQITWDGSLQPSSLHGVTTVLMGNCGVGFAPCRPGDRDGLVKLMEGVEDIPGAVMETGLPWSWETFPDYLDFLETRECDIDFAAQVPHGPVRMYVMGTRGADREPARPEDLQRMTQIVKEAVAAGALGFSTTRTMIHRSKTGKLAPSVTAAESELMAIGLGLRDLGKGTIQMVDDFHATQDENSDEFRMVERLVEASRRPLTLSLVQRPDAPDRWRILLNLIERANDKGLDITGQVCSRPIGLLFGLHLSTNPFYMCPSYMAISDLPLERRVEMLRKPALRDRILIEESTDPSPEWLAMTRSVEEMFEFDDPPNYSPSADERLGVRARKLGISALELAYQILLTKGGRAILYRPIGNFARHTLDPTLEMMKSDHTVIGIGDGGAHLGMICDASLPTHMLSYWTRDRDGERVPLGKAVKMLTSAPAAVIGLNDRGVIAPGYRADLNIIDYDHLELGYPYPVNDLPGGGMRLMQKARGIVATYKNGMPIYRGGEATGFKPGRLIRGARDGPRHEARH